MPRAHARAALRGRRARGRRREPRGASAGRLPRDRAVPPARTRTRHGPPGGSPARTRGRRRHGRAVDAPLLRARRQHPPLRSRHRDARGARAPRRPGVRERARRAPGDRGVLPPRRPHDDRLPDLADRVLPRRRTGLQRRAGRDRRPGRARRALPLGVFERIPVARPVERQRAWPDPDRDHADGRAARARRGDRADRLRGAGGHGRRRRPGQAADRGARGHPRRTRRAPRRAAPPRPSRAQARHRAVQLPAERGRRRHRRLPLGLRVPAEHPRAARPRGLRRRRAGLGRDAARARARRQRRRLRHRRERARDGTDGRSRGEHPVARGDRGAVGTGAGQAPDRRARRVRARRAARQRHRRAAAGLRLRGRPDAAPVRGRLRADARLLGLLPLPSPDRERRRAAAFRHARGARVHARQAVGAVGRLLAGAAHRRHPERLLLRGQQPLRGEHRQASERGHAGQLPDPVGDRGGPVQGAGRVEGGAAAVEGAAGRVDGRGHPARRRGERAPGDDRRALRDARARHRRGRARLLARVRRGDDPPPRGAARRVREPAHPLRPARHRRDALARGTRRSPARLPDGGRRRDAGKDGGSLPARLRRPDGGPVGRARSGTTPPPAAGSTRCSG